MRDMTIYLYVLPTAYEDLLKVGISADPLVRAHAFSRRYYESFDLAASMLVEFDRRSEARRRESALHRLLRRCNADQPLLVPRSAAGHTEWYRGACADVRGEIEADRERGYMVHAPGLQWWRTRLRQQEPLLYEWASRMLAESPDGVLDADRLQQLADVVDAWPALGLALGDVLPPSLLHWYRLHRLAGQPGLAP
jgi:predicted GIY-YIG superfamily endonuclease